MEPQRWREVEALFERALELPAAERTAFLEQHSVGDVELRREVAAMLRADDGDSGIAASIGQAFEVAVDDEPIPDRIGPYRVRGEIGRGGLSTVLLGERDDREYHMQVAIKLVRRGLDTADLLRRLRQERQILARLDHPNIARLLDGGSTEDGRPYVVMERIEGREIDVYCQQQDLTLEQRLRLFVTVCDAVAYAHRNLVIHRDIKPANILVTDDGQAKLLDFGIAKLLRPDQHDPQNAAQTLPGLRLLTPEYASPEQVKGEALTTATDVYSLGGLLYELLTGERPHRLESRDAKALERVICGQDPEKPSQRVRAPSSQEGPKVGGSDGGRLKGDLDTIVLTALHREPERRYPSVEQLAEDIERHLTHRPIRARRDGWAYLLGKWARRHRAAVAGGGLLISVLVGASVVTSQQARIAEQERQRAEAQSARATSVSDFLVEIFEVSDPGEARGNSITAREILDRGSERLLSELDEQPQARATLADTMGRVYQNLGLYSRAAELTEQALSWRLELLGEEHLEVAASLDQLGQVRFHQGRYRQSSDLIERALHIRQQILGSEHIDTLESLNNLAALRFSLGDLEQAEQLFRQSLQAREQLLGPDHEDVAAALDNLATVLQRSGRPEEAEPLLRRSLASRLALQGENHPEVATARSDLAALLHIAGRLEDAEPLYREALESQLAVLGDEHPQVAVSSANLAALLRDRGADGEAEILLGRAITIQRKHLGDDHVRLSYPLINLADLLRTRSEAGELDRAETLYREALAIRRRALPPGHADLASPLVGLARLELARLELGRSARGPSGQVPPPSKTGSDAAAVRALALAEEAAALRRAALREGHPARAEAERLVERCRSASAAAAGTTRR